MSKTDPLKRVVAQWGAEQEALFRGGKVTSDYTKRLTVAQWVDRWLAARSVEASTARKDSDRLRNHVLPKWGVWPLASVARLDVGAWVKELSQSGLGPATVRGIYQLFGTIMAEAVREGVILQSPCQKITLPKVQRATPRWLTRHEYDRIQLALSVRTVMSGGAQPVPDPSVPTWRALVGLACFSGLRPGELAGLDIAALDLERQLVHAEQVLTREGLRAYPKSDRSNRWVPFPPEVANLLWPIVADRPESEPVFTAPGGGRVLFEGNFPGRVWHPTLAAAGIEPVRFYVCRHTACSWLVQAGVPDRKIMGFMGHANTHLIDLYGHLAPDAHDEIRAAWGETPRRTSDPRPLSDPRWSESFGWSESSSDDVAGG